MDTAAHMIMAMHGRPDRIASALWIWLRRHNQTTAQLCAYLGCPAPTLERLTQVPLPHPGSDWADDVEIIAVSLRLSHSALRTLLIEAETPVAREYGA